MSMGMISVQHNLTAMFSNRQLKITNGTLHKTTEKLSSGYRINRSADDAAGLAISEKMRKQIRGLTQASANLQDGVSLSQVADGALTEVHDMVHRINELSIKAANGTLSSSDRKYINAEVQSLKKEISRVFKTTKFNEVEIFRTVDAIINPEIENYPTDMGVFHAGNGAIGGLEFNNVRYTISELQAAGLAIDDNGIATGDFETEFKLWNNETVKLSMKAGNTLNSAVRKYTWEATDKGIFINNALAAEWSDIEFEGQLGKVNGKNFLTGDYSFSYHGMQINFNVDSDLNLSEMMERVNGYEEIPPATWDVSVGSVNSAKPADIDNSVTRRIDVTEANKSYINHTFRLVADENGLAVRDTTAGNQTAYVAWNTFKDSSLVTVYDENGNPVPTNNGYPIVDWGNSDYDNGEAGITFDAGATYHFVSPDPNLKIEFDFSLAEYASLDEVKAALNGATLTTSSTYVSGRITSTEAGNGSISISANPFTSNFILQRDYGRDFNTAGDTMTGSLNVQRTTLDDQPSSSDRPDSTGGYSDGSHAVSRSLADRTRDSVSSSTPSAPAYVTIQPETYYETVQDTDENGDPRFDDNGDPVYVQEERIRWHYYEQYDVNCTEIYTNTYDATDRWTQDVTYTFDGTFEGHDMTDVENTQQETYTRDLTQTRQETYTYVRKEIREVDASSLNSYVQSILADNPGLLENPGSSFSGQYETPDGTIINIGRAGSYNPDILSHNGEISNRNTTYGDYVTLESSIGAESLESVSFSSMSVTFKDENSDNLFTFNYGITLDTARSLANSSGTVDIGTVKFTAGSAYRNFRPNENNRSISEAQFSNVNVNEVFLNIPERHLIIQSGADSDDQIDMSWSPLNLWSLGLYKTKLLTEEGALAAIDQTAQALQVISNTRERFGAYQNRFEHAIKMTDNTVENTSYSESKIRDTDMAKEMVKYANQNIIAQAGMAMLASANQSKNVVLALLTQR